MTQGDDAYGNAQRGIGSTESRLATLRWPLDFNEMDHFASSNVDLFGQRSAPPSASARSKVESMSTTDLRWTTAAAVKRRVQSPVVNTAGPLHTYHV